MFSVTHRKCVYECAFVILCSSSTIPFLLYCVILFFCYCILVLCYSVQKCKCHSVADTVNRGAEASVRPYEPLVSASPWFLPRNKGQIKSNQNQSYSANFRCRSWVVPEYSVHAGLFNRGIKGLSSSPELVMMTTDASILKPFAPADCPTPLCPAVSRQTPYSDERREITKCAQ